MKTKAPSKIAHRRAHNGHGVTLDRVIESAKQTGRDARDAAVDQFVQPAMHAVREAGHQVEAGFHHSVDYVEGRLKDAKARAAENPVRALACAVGAGVLLGLWLRRK